MRRLRGQRAVAAHPHPPRAQDVDEDERSAGPEPHARERSTRRPSTRGRGARAPRSTASTPTTLRCLRVAARGRARGSSAASRPRSWTGRTTSPTPSTTSRTRCTPGTWSLAALRSGQERAHLVELCQERLRRGGGGRCRRDGAGPAARRTLVADRQRRLPARLAALKNLTSQLIGRFCTAAEAATRDALQRARPLRRYGADLVVPDETRLECAVLKAVTAVYVMGREKLPADQGEAARHHPRPRRGDRPPRASDGRPGAASLPPPMPPPYPVGCASSSTRSRP